MYISSTKHGKPLIILLKFYIQFRKWGNFQSEYVVRSLYCNKSNFVY
jgi:hypothetical protein